MLIDNKDEWSESFKAEVLIPFRTVAAANENSTTRWQHCQPQSLLHFYKMERCSNMSSTFFPCKSLHFRCEIIVKGFFNVCTFTVYASCEQQSRTPTLPAGFNQTCKLLEGSQAESIPRNRLTLLVTMWTLMAHSCLQWLPGCLRLAASCSWFNSGPVPSSVDPVRHLDTKNKTDRTKLSC